MNTAVMTFESHQGIPMTPTTIGKLQGVFVLIRTNKTSTDFCETETSSSGINKATQAEERQGYVLCTIGDGEDCKFGIYDDASPFDSKLRNRPEYQRNICCPQKGSRKRRRR